LIKELAVLCDQTNGVFYCFPSIAAYCVDINDDRLTDSKLYLLIKTSDNKYNLGIYSWPFTELGKIICIKDTIIGGNMSMKLSANKCHVVLAVECTTTELDIIVKTVRKNHMSHHDGSTKFYAIDTEKDSGVLKVCYRQLTKIPCLANCWEVFSDHLVVFGENRVTLLWDISNGSCDQRMIKGTKTAMVYRPGWIEDDPDYMKICHGKTTCMMLSRCGKVLAVGSEDGYVMAYAVPRGHSVLEDVGKKPNHGNVVSVM
jgi:hypothetical protein